jgi:hypothetical protein
MKLDVIAEVWLMMKDSILSTDRDTVAENLVGILIDNDYSPADIKAAFRGDLDMMDALTVYVDDSSDFEDADYEEYDEPADEEDYDDEWN